MHIQNALNNYLDKPREKELRSERQYILKQFLDIINTERIGTKYKPMTGREIAIRLAHVKSKQTLYEFLGNCKENKEMYGSFSKYFFGKLKVKK